MSQLLNKVNQLNNDYWTLITSDPGKRFTYYFIHSLVTKRFHYVFTDIFNDMWKEYGVKDTKAEELYAIDFSNLEDNG